MDVVSVVVLGGVAGTVVYLVLWDRQRRAEYREDRDRARARREVVRNRLIDRRK